jgi:hypothetical protein
MTYYIDTDKYIDNSMTVQIREIYDLKFLGGTPGYSYVIHGTRVQIYNLF